MWQETTEGVIVQYQKEIIDFIREGYDERTVSAKLNTKLLILKDLPHR